MTVFQLIHALHEYAFNEEMNVFEDRGNHEVCINHDGSGADLVVVVPTKPRETFHLIFEQ